MTQHRIPFDTEVIQDNAFAMEDVNKDEVIYVALCDFKFVAIFLPSSLLCRADALGPPCPVVWLTSSPSPRGVYAVIRAHREQYLQY